MFPFDDNISHPSSLVFSFGFGLCASSFHPSPVVSTLVITPIGRFSICATLFTVCQSRYDRCVRFLKRQEQVFCLSSLCVFPARVYPSINPSIYPSVNNSNRIKFHWQTLFHQVFILLTRKCQYCCRRCFDNTEHRRYIR